MSRPIRRVAVLGAGIMGTGIAAHLANAGIDSVLYDIVPKDAPAGDSKARTKYAIDAIAAATKSKPASFFDTAAASRITPANYEDHADLLADCDWVIEVVVERLDIKHKMYKWVADHAPAHAILSSNTSGIPLSDLTSDMSDDMKSRFLITHFFNPVRYMRLLELVTGPTTSQDAANAVAEFGAKALGKGIVWGKDTPNFVANRIGLYGISSVLHHMDDVGLNITEVDSIFGAAMGRAKSAVFRTGDVVGIDTLVHTFENVYDGALDDEERDRFVPPAYIKKLVESGATGEKAGVGFYKKTKVDGKRVIKALNPATGEYEAQEKTRFPSIGKARGKDTSAEKIEAIVYGDDKASQIAWKVTVDTLIYSANRIPEIADDIVNLDRGMKWGFGWDLGPFETWDAIGVAKSIEKMEAEGRTVPSWVKDMVASGRESFYARNDAGAMTYYGRDGKIVTVPRPADHFIVDDARAAKSPLKTNPSASLHDIGDDILLLEFHSKMNAIDEQIIDTYEYALDQLDAGEFAGLVVGNQDGKAFCAGANVLMILMGAMQGEWDAMEAQVARLQNLMQRAKYSNAPVVTAPYGLTLGGGAEIAMHSAATRANGELYMGLVEAGVGLIPGAGGCKEMVVRYLGDIPKGVAYDPNPYVQKVFEHIGMAKIATSAEEARQMGFLRPTDVLSLDIDALIHDAKQTAIGLVAGGYKAPAKRTVKLPGKSGAAAIEAFLDQMHSGGYATDHDVTVGSKLAYVLTGGDIPSNSWVTEQQLLDVEREAFLSLAGEAKSQARMTHMLQKGRPLRN